MSMRISQKCLTVAMFLHNGIYTDMYEPRRVNGFDDKVYNNANVYMQVSYRGREM